MKSVGVTLWLCVLTDEQSATAAEANISPLILNVWANNIFDPFISIDALDTLQVGWFVSFIFF
jgi:hypothetical protein